MTSDKIADIVAAYCSERPEIVACYLFGSQATRRARPGSDVDLAFLLADGMSRQERFDLRMKYFADLSGLLHKEVDVVILNEVGEVLLGQIFAKGKVICGGESDPLRAFRRRKLPLIAEFSYYIDLRLAKFRARYGGEAHV
jgi:predicted nucleotidyltransferase